MAATGEVSSRRDAVEMNLRERNKADKLRRIKEAAQRLFEEKGYERTSVRDIAKLADVGQTTVFAYAPEKRDLIFLIMNDRVSEMLQHTASTLNRKLGLMESLLYIYRNVYGLHNQFPVMSQLLLKELTFFEDTGKPDSPAGKFHVSYNELSSLIVERVQLTQNSGLIAANLDPRLLAKLIGHVYRSEVRIWFGSDRSHDIELGLHDLEISMTLLLQGCDPKPEVFSRA